MCVCVVYASMCILFFVYFVFVNSAAAAVVVGVVAFVGFGLCSTQIHVKLSIVSTMFCVIKTHSPICYIFLWVGMSCCFCCWSCCWLFANITFFLLSFWCSFRPTNHICCCLKLQHLNDNMDIRTNTTHTHMHSHTCPLTKDVC